MDRNINHFEDRLEKDTYSKDEVAKLLHNEADFTATKTKKEFDGMVSKDDYDALNTELTSVKEALAPYKEADFDKLASSEFEKLNGAPDRIGDFKTLANLKGDEDAETIAVKATELKKSGKYDFMFTNIDSGGIKTTTPHTLEQKKPIKGSIVPKVGSWNLFKKK